MIDLYYDESSPSCLRWSRDKLGGVGIRAGDKAGSLDSKGYWRVGINGRDYRAHRVIMHLTGFLDINSPLQVDHINRDKRDNRLSNLRIVTNQENQFNKGVLCNNTSGITGVIWYKPTGKWKAQMRVNKRNKHLGYFGNLFDAACCRRSAELELQRI